MDPQFLKFMQSRGFSPDDVKQLDSTVASTSQNPSTPPTTPEYSPQQLTGNLEGTSIPYPITQTYGQQSPYDVFSGGVNTGVDYATPANTPVYLPNDNWTVQDAVDNATHGYIGDSENQGYGNSVVVKNNRTGEKLRLSHLNALAVQPGQQFTGGLLGLSGATGNVTGPHLDAEYTDPTGQMGDVLKTPYANLFGNQTPTPQK